MNISKHAKAWFKIIRLPNLFTVPGDIIIGFLSANGNIQSPVFVYVLISSLLIYCFGLVTNDISDINEDREKRPERPLPSGSISMLSASIFSVSALFFSFFFASLCGRKTIAVWIVLTGIILLYNLFSKRGGIFPGPLSLASCRALNILLGTSAARSSISNPDLYKAILLTAFIYVYGVSLAASTETESSKKCLLLSGIIILLAIFLWVIFAFSATSPVISRLGEVPPLIKIAFFYWGLMALGTLWVIIKWLFLRISQKIPSDIAFLIRNLIFFQASACAFSGFNLRISVIIVLMYIPAFFASKIAKGS